MRGFQYPLREKETFPVLVIRMELSLDHFPYDTFPTSGFHGQGTGWCEKLDVVIHVYAVLSHGWFLGVIDVPMVLFDAGCVVKPKSSLMG
jgi:hypothetical protein